ncbi:hypothetical protein [Streptomyces sp. enrichment culture]|uniref:hypothetical protein n=1 Tax=Streptomyces sp. enrichment culture TaxID=1795815 RepID=UPI003F56D219
MPAMDLKFAVGRPAYPYQDEDPAVMANRDQQNLNKAAGANPPILLARHHLIPLNDVIWYWNFAVQHFYTGSNKVPVQVKNFFAQLIKYVDAAPLAAVANKNALVAFLDALKDGNLSHEGGVAGQYVEQKEEFRQIFAWCPGNLIIGPRKIEPGHAGRVDDPENVPDVYLAEEAGSHAISALLTCRELLVAGQEGPADNRTLRPDYVGLLKNFFDGYRKLFAFKAAASSYPQKVSDKAWEKIPPNWHYAKTFVGRNETPVRADYATNMTGMTLRQAKARSKKCPVGAKIPIDKTPLHAHTVPFSLPTNIMIGNTEVPLFVDTTWNDGSSECTRYRGSVHAVQMADVLSWAADTWKIPVDVPDWVRDLELRDAAFETVVSGQWNSWKVSLSVTMDVSGTTADTVVTLECATGRAVALGAYLALRKQNAPEADPLLLSGAITHTAANGWELTASLASVEPIQIVDLVRSFSISPEDLPDELSAMAPAVSNADILYTRSAAGQVLALAVKTEHVEIALACTSSKGTT